MEIFRKWLELQVWSLKEKYELSLQTSERKQTDSLSRSYMPGTVVGMFCSFCILVLKGICDLRTIIITVS
jgi:hypothetical protein